MMKPTRLLAVAAAIHMTVGAGRASAQTLIVRHAPIGSTVELVVNSTKAGTAQADAAGDVRIPVNLPTHTSKSEIDARIYVDVCDALRRVLVVERNAAVPPPETGCARQELTGVFEVRRVSTLVVNVAGPAASLLLRQGPYSLRPPTAWRLAPKGFVIFGGGALAKYPNALEFGCEGVPTCAGDDSGAGYTGGAEYWFTRYVAAEGSYVKPPELTVTGNGTGYRFDSHLDPHVVTIAGKVGVPIGPVRMYVKAGFNYARAESGTTQNIDAVTTTTEAGVTTITPASTQTVEATTSGWGWLLGGGIEAWVAPSFALYAEGGGLGLKGKTSDANQGQLDDRLMLVTFGIRVRIGG